MSRFNDDAAAGGPSKTQLKQAMLQLQLLGEALLKLSDARLDDIPMEENLREALRSVPRMRTREARRRQMQYVGKLLRLADVAPLQAAVDEDRAGRAESLRAFQRIEDWRDRLLAADAGTAATALTEWVAAHPGVDVPALRQLIRNARREQVDAEAAAPPQGAAAKGRHYRALFQRLRAALGDDAS